MPGGELVVFPDVEQLAITALDTLAGREPNVHAATRVPTPRPAEFLRVLRFGGPKETIVSENAQLIIEAWASTETRASYLLSIARAILNAQNGVLFGVNEISGPNNLPDPTTSQIRYTQSFGVRARGTVLA